MYFLNGLRSPKRRRAREAVPDLDHALHGPLGGDLGEFFLAGKSGQVVLRGGRRSVGCDVVVGRNPATTTTSMMRTLVKSSPKPAYWTGLHGRTERLYLNSSGSPCSGTSSHGEANSIRLYGTKRRPHCSLGSTRAVRYGEYSGFTAGSLRGSQYMTSMFTERCDSYKRELLEEIPDTGTQKIRMYLN